MTDVLLCCGILLTASKHLAAGLIILNWGPYNNRNLPLYDMPQAAIDIQLDGLSNWGAQIIPVSSIININDARNYLPTDGHPSATANQSIAQWLATHTTFNN